jgi:hypothetical protein
MEDNLAWHFDPKEAFLEKSSYNLGVLLRDRKQGRQVECSSKNTGDSVCQTQLGKNLGSAGTQQIKMFVWRLTHNILASRMKIMRLGVDLDIACPVWHRDDGGQTF